MRIAIAAEGDQVAAHFGRCAEFCLVDIAGSRVVGQTRVAAPPHSPHTYPSFLAEVGAECVVAGGMGPGALRLFEEIGIPVVLGVDGAVSAAAESLAAGTLEARSSTCSHPGSRCESPDCSCHHSESGCHGGPAAVTGCSG